MIAKTRQMFWNGYNTIVGHYLERQTCLFLSVVYQKTIQKTDQPIFDLMLLILQFRLRKKQFISRTNKIHIMLFLQRRVKHSFFINNET